MDGKLFGVGVGPGDPELLTLKALRVIQEAEVIAVPKTDGQMLTALQIAQAACDLSGKEILEVYMPMTRKESVLKDSHQKGAQALIQRLANRKNIAFLTLGDPSIYSTYIYLHTQVLEAGFEAQLIPGVPSFCAVAARLNDSLCTAGEPLHIIPASYEGLADYLDWQGTKVLMKSGEAFNQVRTALQERELLAQASMVERCGMAGEKVYHDLNTVEGKTSYFSIIVLKDREKEKMGEAKQTETAQQASEVQTELKNRQKEKKR